MTATLDRIALVTRSAIAVSAVAISSVFLWGSMTSEDGSSSWIGWAATLAIVAWWLSPLIMYARSVKTLALAVCIGAAYPIVASAGLVAVFVSDSSTAGIGLGTIPVLLWGGVFALLLTEQVVTSRRRHVEPDEHGRS